MTRFINIILVLITLAGVVMLVRQRSAHSSVRSEFDRLSKQYGVLNVANPDNYYVNFVESEDPHCFRWRIYVPPIDNMIEELITKSGGQSSSTSGGGTMEGAEFLHFCRIRFDPKCQVYKRGRFGSSTSSISDEKVGRFVEEHWDELDIDLLGAEGPVEIDRNQPVRLIAIRIPENLQDELVEIMEQDSQIATSSKWKERPILEVVFGSEQAFLKREN